MLASILLFVIITHISGLAAVQLATGRYRLDFETHVMCTGVGLAVFALVTALFGLFGVSLSWFNYLLAAGGLFSLGALRDIVSKQVSEMAKTREAFWASDSRYLVAAIALAAALFAIYLNRSEERRVG